MSALERSNTKTDANRWEEQSGHAVGAHLRGRTISGGHRDLLLRVIRTPRTCELALPGCAAPLCGRAVATDFLPIPTLEVAASSGGRAGHPLLQAL